MLIADLLLMMERNSAEAVAVHCLSRLPKLQNLRPSLSNHNPNQFSNNRYPSPFISSLFRYSKFSNSRYPNRYINSLLSSSHSHSLSLQ